MENVTSPPVVLYGTSASGVPIMCEPAFWVDSESRILLGSSPSSSINGPYLSVYELHGYTLMIPINEDHFEYKTD